MLFSMTWMVVMARLICSC